jgi:hypothetical protein
LQRPQEDAALGAQGYAIVEMPPIDRTAPICTECGEVIEDPKRNGAITLTADTHRWPEELPFCVLENPRYHVHHRSPRCAPRRFVRWSPLFSWWFKEFVDGAALYVTAREHSTLAAKAS